MVNLMIEQLLFKTDFLDEYAEELKALYNDESFMSIVRDIMKTLPLPDSSANIEKIKTVAKITFFEKGLKDKYSALNKIVQSVKSRNCASNSAYISVFLAMWIFIIKNGPVSNLQNESDEDSDLNFRKKYEAIWRCDDGHYVRSKNEMLVDNWLYYHDICHAYERPVNADTVITYYSDFYVPMKKLYIEVWGYKNEKYIARMKRKQKVYAEKGYELLDMDEKMLQYLDDTLGKIFR